MGRNVDECRYRRCTAELSFCGLVEEFINIRDTELSIVDRTACETCCDAFPPSRSDPNSVVAALLIGACEQVIAQDGIDELSCERAAEIRQFAEDNLPALRPTEDEIGENDHVVMLAPEAPFESVLPRPNIRSGSPVVKWCVGITTAPRRVSTFVETIQSVVAAGWERPRIFSDGFVDIPKCWCDLPVTVRNPRVGAWPSYYLALTEMLMREPNADACVLFQDDIELPARSDLREYLERILWPGDVPGIVSLYCSSEYTRDAPGWHRFDGEWMWGATAFVFSPEAIRGLITSEEVLRHRLKGIGDGLGGIDVAIGDWARLTETPIWFPTPSLVQHTGQVSTLWDKARAVSERRANSVIQAVPGPAPNRSTSPFKFVLLSTGRCGTTLLQHALEQHSQIRIGGEPLCENAKQIQFRELIRTMFLHELPDSLIGPDDRAIITNADYMEGVFELVDGVSIHYWHLGDVFDSLEHYLSHRSDLRVIQLIRRNDFERYVSLQFARQTEVWHTSVDQDEPPQQSIHIDPVQFLASTTRAAEDIYRFREFFDGKICTLYYEDLIADWEGSIAQIQRFIQVPHESLRQGLKKSIRRPMREIVQNYDQVRESCADTFAETYFTDDADVQPP